MKQAKNFNMICCSGSCDRCHSLLEKPVNTVNIQSYSEQDETEDRGPSKLQAGVAVVLMWI